MGITVIRTMAAAATAIMLAVAPGTAIAAERGYSQVVEGVAVYFGILPSELIRGHPRGHAESGMHGGKPPGEFHLTVALFDAKSGARLTDAGVTAHITDGRGLDEKKTLEPMLIAGNQTYGNYFKMADSGPYRIDILIRRPAPAGEIRASFTWVRS